MSQTASSKIPRPLADDQWVCLTQTLPIVLKKLPKTQQGENSTMTVQELQNLRTRIDDLRKLNDQLIYHRLPALQHVVDGLHVISTTQHQQLKLALANGDDDEDDDDLLDNGDLTPEQQVQIAYRKAEDASYRYHKAKERFDGITSQFEEYGQKTKGLMGELESQQQQLTTVRENSKLLVKDIVQNQGQIGVLEKSQRELTAKHTAIESTVSTLTTQLSIGNEQLLNETTQYHTQTASLSKSIGTLESDIVALQDNLKGLISTVSQRQGVIVHLEDEIDKLSSLEQRCADYKLTKLNNRNELNTLKTKEQQLNTTFQQDTAQTQQLDLDIKKTQMEQTSKTNRINETRGEIDRLELTLRDNIKTITTLKNGLSDATTAYHDSISTITSQNNSIQNEVQGQLDQLKTEAADQQEVADKALNQHKHDFHHRKMALNNTLNLNRAKANNLEQTKRDVQHQLTECRTKIEMLRNDIVNYQNQQQNQSNAIQQRFLELQQMSADLEAEEQFLKQRKITQLVKRREFELQNEEFIAQDVYRRKLHNTLQDLKGNIRVLCRIRPNLPHDGSTDGHNPLQHQRGSNELKLQVKDKEHRYQFETIFGQDSTQKEVFTEVQEIVQSAIDGYEVCLFSYGQTGSGKSHTMTGSLDNAEGKGIIPRSVDLIFQNVNDLKAQSPGWDIKLSVSCIQIYLDKISDLLTTDRCSNDLKITNDQVNKKINVQNLTFRPTPTTQHVYKALDDAQRLRVVAATGMNATSSRSHFVFTLHIDMNNTELNQHHTGVLNLCDLAGSERVSSAQTTGEQFKETQKINSSLSTLNRVFMELAENKDHIPFRETKLTELLQYCLSGDGKTLMIVNLSPAPTSAQETNGSLQLASTVSRVQRGQRGANSTNQRPLASNPAATAGLRSAAVTGSSTAPARNVVPTPMSQTSTRSFAPSQAGTVRRRL